MRQPLSCCGKGLRLAFALVLLACWFQLGDLIEMEPENVDLTVLVGYPPAPYVHPVPGPPGTNGPAFQFGEQAFVGRFARDVLPIPFYSNFGARIVLQLHNHDGGTVFAIATPWPQEILLSLDVASDGPNRNTIRLNYAKDDLRTVFTIPRITGRWANLTLTVIDGAVMLYYNGCESVMTSPMARHPSLEITGRSIVYLGLAGALRNHIRASIYEARLFKYPRRIIPDCKMEIGPTAVQSPVPPISLLEPEVNGASRSLSSTSFLPPTVLTTSKPSGGTDLSLIARTITFEASSSTKPSDSTTASSLRLKDNPIQPAFSSVESGEISKNVAPSKSYLATNTTIQFINRSNVAYDQAAGASSVSTPLEPHGNYVNGPGNATESTLKLVQDIKSLISNFNSETLRAVLGSKMNKKLDLLKNLLDSPDLLETDSEEFQELSRRKSLLDSEIDRLQSGTVPPSSESTEPDVPPAGSVLPRSAIQATGSPSALVDSALQSGSSRNTGAGGVPSSSEKSQQGSSSDRTQAFETTQQLLSQRQVAPATEQTKNSATSIEKNLFNNFNTKEMTEELRKNSKDLAVSDQPSQSGSLSILNSGSPQAVTSKTLPALPEHAHEDSDSLDNDGASASKTDQYDTDALIDTPPTDLQNSFGGAIHKQDTDRSPGEPIKGDHEQLPFVPVHLRCTGDKDIDEGSGVEGESTDADLSISCLPHVSSNVSGDAIESPTARARTPAAAHANVEVTSDEDVSLTEPEQVDSDLDPIMRATNVGIHSTEAPKRDIPADQLSSTDTMITDEGNAEEPTSSSPNETPTSRTRSPDVSPDSRFESSEHIRQTTDEPYFTISDASDSSDLDTTSITPVTPATQEETLNASGFSDPVQPGPSSEVEAFTSKSPRLGTAELPDAEIPTSASVSSAYSVSPGGRVVTVPATEVTAAPSPPHPPQRSSSAEPPPEVSLSSSPPPPQESAFSKPPGSCGCDEGSFRLAIMKVLSELGLISNGSSMPNQQRFSSGRNSEATASSVISTQSQEPSEFGSTGSRAQQYNEDNNSTLTLAALNTAMTGRLGGVSGADGLCHEQAMAAGLKATFRAFLSAKFQDIFFLVRKLDRDRPVVNVHGQRLVNSWTELFGRRDDSILGSVPVLTFSGLDISSDPSWPRKFWHGSSHLGRLQTEGFPCKNWYSNSSSLVGMSSAVGSALTDFPTDRTTCDSRLTLLCVQVSTDW